MNGKERPMIIAMQGDPCTGKTHVANQLARSFKCSTIRLDDVLDVMFPADKPKNADALVSQAFDVITEVVDTQSRNLGLSIIVDSPLSRRSHLQSLVAVSSASAADLIVIECKPKTTYTWLMRFENHTYVDKNKWYKPHSWPFHPWFSRDYDDEDNVPKLVLNTTDPYLVSGLPSVIRGLIKFGEGRKVDYDVWWPIVRAKNAEKNGSSVVKSLCRAQLGHHLNIYMEQGQLKQEANCSVCLKLFSVEGESEDNMAYKCSGCPYAMHKSCAELDGSGSSKTFTPLNFPKFIRSSKPGQAEYCYPEEHSCIGCEKQGKELSYECGYCVFQTHVRCKLVPTIVNRPEVHNHALHFWTNSALPVGRVLSTYHCRACRDVSIKLAGYLCGMCMFYYHAECLLLPPMVSAHEHGGRVGGLSM